MIVKQEIGAKKEGTADPKTEEETNVVETNDILPETNDDDDSGSGNRKNRKGRATNSEGHDFEGENSSIGVVIGLKSERFNKKVVFSTFVENLKNHILTNFDDSKDMMPILDNLKDPIDQIKREQPIDLTL